MHRFRDGEDDARRELGRRWAAVAHELRERPAEHERPNDVRNTAVDTRTDDPSDVRVLCLCGDREIGHQLPIGARSRRIGELLKHLQLDDAIERVMERHRYFAEVRAAQAVPDQIGADAPAIEALDIDRRAHWCPLAGTLFDARRHEPSIIEEAAVRRTLDARGRESLLHFQILRASGYFALLVATVVAFRAHGQDVRDADTLPKNVGGLIIQPGIGYGPGVERFGRGWGFGRESLIKDFNEVQLSDVVGGMGLNLGTTHFQGTQSSIAINFAAAYGVTDRFTLAAFLPFLHAQYRLDAWLSGDTIHSKVKDAHSLQCPNGDFSFNPDQLFDPNKDGQFAIDDVRNAVISDCLDYKDPFDRAERQSDGLLHAIGERSYTGFKDIILGAKYKLYHGEQIQVSTLAYVVLPTGKVNDPRDLFDFNFGDGQTDAALLGAVTIPLGDFRFAGSAGYEISFGDQEPLRLSNVSFSDQLENDLVGGRISEHDLLTKHLDDGSMIPIVTKYDFAEVTRKLGDTVYVYSGFSYQWNEWLSFGVTLDFIHHFRDSISEIGPRFGNVPAYLTEDQVRADVDRRVAAGEIKDQASKDAALRAGLSTTVERRKAAYAWHTVRGNLVAGFGININTLGPFLRDEFPLPILGGISMSRFLAGQNIDTPDAMSLSIIIPIPFGEVKDPAEYGFDSDPGRGLPWP